MVYIGDNADITWFVCEFNGSFNFWKHRAGFEIACIGVFFEFFGGDFVDSLGVWLAKINISVWNSSD